MKRLWKKLNYEIELVSQLFVVFVAATTFGIMEGKWINTDILLLPVLGRFAYYHVGLLVLMATVSFSLAISHIQWIASNRKKYILLMCLASLPLSLLTEDLIWFIVRWQPITRSEWTMIFPGLGINFFNITWIPLWYVLTIAFSTTMFVIANRWAEKGYQKYCKLGKNT